MSVTILCKPAAGGIATDRGTIARGVLPALPCPLAECRVLAREGAVVWVMRWASHGRLGDGRALWTRFGPRHWSRWPAG